MSEIERWTRARLPLEARVLQQATQAARERATQLGLSEAAMAGRLEADMDERARLLEVVVPPESWLFRHAGAFEAVRDWLRARGTRPVRMASLGCARGAEAFSLAASAASLGRTGADTRVVAVDWNARHLRDAAQGHASPLIQRAPLPDWAQALFEPDAQGWLRLRAEPRSMIDWVHADVLTDPPPGPFDVIFCRNMAIYLDETARQALAARLRDVAAPDALLCIGHADPAVLWQDGFEPLPIAGAFAYTRARQHGAPPRRGTPAPARASRRRMETPGASATPAGTSLATTPRHDAVPTLERAQDLADAGRLHDAGEHLHALLQHEPVLAPGWALLGAVRLAQRREAEAEECFRKVVYLRPHDALALLQLSALAEARGDATTAGRLRLRAARSAAGDDA